MKLVAPEKQSFSSYHNSKSFMSKILPYSTDIKKKKMIAVVTDSSDKDNSISMEENNRMS